MSNHNHHADSEKLKIILPHLLKHNREHLGDMAQWRDRARYNGFHDVADDLDKVIGYYERTIECLESAIAKLAAAQSDI